MSSRDVAILIVAVVLFVVFALAGPRFLSGNNLVDIARRAAILGILAVGMTYLFVAGEARPVDRLALRLPLILMSFQEERLGIDPWLAAGVVILIGLMIGAVNGLLVTRVGLPSFITTLGMLALLRGAANAVSSGYPIPAKNTDLAFYQIIRANFPGTPIPNLFVAMLVVMVIGGIVLARTKFGSDVYATGGDVEAARNNGIDTKAREARVLRADGRSVRPQRSAAVRPGRPRAAQRRGQSRAAGDRRGDHRRGRAVRRSRHDLRQLHRRADPQHADQRHHPDGVASSGTASPPARSWSPGSTSWSGRAPERG